MMYKSADNNYIEIGTIVNLYNKPENADEVWDNLTIGTDYTVKDMMYKLSTKSLFIILEGVDDTYYNAVNFSVSKSAIAVYKELEQLIEQLENKDNNIII